MMSCDVNGNIPECHGDMHSVIKCIVQCDVMGHDANIVQISYVRI